MEETATPNCPATQDFEARVREHQAGVRAFIRALGADEAWVDDLAQEAFIVAHRRLNQFEPGTDFGKWLRSIARYIVANERRKEARHSRLLPFAVVDALLADEPESGVETRITDLLPAMRDCVEELPARSRDLLQRRYADNENATTLARGLRMNADAVRQQLLRIRPCGERVCRKEGRWTLVMNSQRYQELLGRQSDDPVVELDNLSDSGSVRPNDSASNRSGEPQPGKLIT